MCPPPPQSPLPYALLDASASLCAGSQPEYDNTGGEELRRLVWFRVQDAVELHVAQLGHLASFDAVFGHYSQGRHARLSSVRSLRRRGCLRTKCLLLSAAIFE